MNISAATLRLPDNPHNVPPVMRAHLLTLAAFAVCLPLLGCPKKSGSATADAGGTTSSATDTATAKPPAPPDGATSCTVTLTGKVIGTGKDAALEFKMKNTGSRALRFCQINAFGYDKTGAVAGHGALSENHELKPGEDFTSSFGVSVSDDKSNNVANTPGLTFVVAVSHVIFSDNSEWEDSKFDYTKGRGPNAATAAASASASGSAAPTAAPATAAATGAHPLPGRPARPAPPKPR
jgi:hypothetical protein